MVASNFNGWQKDIQKKVGKKDEDKVTFLEFIDFVLSNGAGADSEHLDSYYHHCDMCRIRYDFIGKFETFAEDTQYILMKTGKVTLVRFTMFEASSLSRILRTMPRGNCKSRYVNSPLKWDFTLTTIL